jgi:hypothetical protein
MQMSSFPKLLKDINKARAREEWILVSILLHCTELRGRNVVFANTLV